MATTLAALPTVAEGPMPRLWTRDEYHRMAQVGLLGEDARTELIEGQIYEKMPQGKAHVVTIKLLYRALMAMFGPEFDLSMQTPLRLGEAGEPEPDLLVLRGGPRDYEARDRDSASDIALIVEISDSTLAFDRKVKARVYADHGVPEYWIVNLRERTLEIRRGPQKGRYEETLVLREGESVEMGGGTISVSDILPQP